MMLHARTHTDTHMHTLHRSAPIQTRVGGEGSEEEEEDAEEEQRSGVKDGGGGSEGCR